MGMRKQSEDEQVLNGAEPVKIVWSREDEILVLQGIIDYAVDKGKSCFSAEHKSGFYDFMKLSLLHLAPTPDQLTQKVSRLKRKYIQTERPFIKTHDQNCLELCQRIWQSNGIPFEPYEIANNNGSESVDKDSESSLGDWFHHSFVLSSIVGLGVDEDTVKQGWCKVAVEDKEELLNRYSLLLMDTREYLKQKLQLQHEIASILS